MKIQISDVTHKLLQDIGGFIMEERGPTNIKVEMLDQSQNAPVFSGIILIDDEFSLTGEGVMLTYWLNSSF